MSNIKIPKKLIEVALPLDDINSASGYEKLPGIGAHPRGIHHWWARRPFAAARAIIFAQMVNDPGGERGYYSGKTKAQADKEREELFEIVRSLADWKQSENEEVLAKAKELIKLSWRETCALNKGNPQFEPENLPAFHDPFAGGGAIPLEAQRLGLESFATDLNPVATMINKAMIEIPGRFADKQPIGPTPNLEKQGNLELDFIKAKGLAEDVRRYGHWVFEKAKSVLEQYYPRIVVTDKDCDNRDDLLRYKGQSLEVVSWLWARTVKSPNPAFGSKDVPLIKSFVLCNKKGRETWLEPILKDGRYHFEIKTGTAPSHVKSGTKASGANFKCILSGSAIDPKYIKEQAKLGRMGFKLIGIVANGIGGKVYLPPSEEHENIAKGAVPSWEPGMEFFEKALGFRVGAYGLKEWKDLFTPRQLTSLSIISDVIKEAKEKITTDCINSGMEQGVGLNEGGSGAIAYAEAVTTYLAFSLDRSADFNNSLTGWRPGNEKIMGLFNRQAIPMVWDFGEANILANVVGGFITNVEYQSKCIAKLPASGKGNATQADAANQSVSCDKVISTDPPYYDNIGYADLSDFFYVWLRRTIKDIWPREFSTLAVPKMEELVATPIRHGTKLEAEGFFLKGMTSAMGNIARNAHPAFPVTIYYAFKQSETKGANTTSTGWETFLESVLSAGFMISGTWPMRSEQSTRIRGVGANALASSIVLVCKKMDEKAESISRRQFQRELREEMPDALSAMIGGSSGASPIAPVDLAQAAIGPGMAIFSKYEAVLNQDGSKMSVHDALILINRAITDYLNPDSGNFDNDTLFCDSWFSQYGWGQGQFGEADTLARAKGTSVDGVRDAGVVESGGGKVRLLRWSEYPTDWDPKGDSRIPVWEACHQMIRVLNQKGEAEAGALLARMPDLGEQVRQLAYHLYTLCERKKWAEEARAYNELIGSWHAIVTASNEVGHRGEQHGLDFDF